MSQVGSDKNGFLGSAMFLSFSCVICAFCCFFLLSWAFFFAGSIVFWRAGVVVRLHPAPICFTPAARRLGRNPPASDARCHDSAQRFFIVRTALPARTQLVQLPSDTTCSPLALFPPFCRPREGSTSASRHVPAASVGKFSLLARERASLNVATVLFSTV
jgi:hypothetical protein